MLSFGLGFLCCEPSLCIHSGPKHLGSGEGVPSKSLKHPHHAVKDIPAGDNGAGIELHRALMSFEIVSNRPELVGFGQGGHFCQVQQDIKTIRTVWITLQVLKVLAYLFRIYISYTGGPNPPSLRVNPVVDRHKENDTLAWLSPCVAILKDRQRHVAQRKLPFPAANTAGKGDKALLAKLTIRDLQGRLLVVQFAVLDSELSFEAARIGPDALGALDQTSVPQQGNFWLGVLHCCYLLSSRMNRCASKSGQNFPRHWRGDWLR